MSRYVPSARLAPLIDQAIRDVTDHRNSPDDIGGMRVLVERTGLTRRTLSAIRNGHRATVHWETADLLLCAIGRPELWHLPSDQGGLADLYGGPSG